MNQICNIFTTCPFRIGG